MAVRCRCNNIATWEQPRIEFKLNLHLDENTFRYNQHLSLKLKFKNNNMGKAKNGIYGPISGKVKNMVWFTRYGVDYVRTKGKRTAPLSAQQKANCSDMKILMAFFKNMKPFLKAGFAQQVAGTPLNYHNVATAYNKIHALRMVDGKAEIDFAEVLLSAGNAKKPQDAQVQLSEKGLEFTWAYDAIEDWESRKDQAMLMAYFPESNEAIYDCSAARRSEAKDLLELHATYLNRQMEVYVAFTTADRADVSTSVYLGSIKSI
jgi:hypothetical protein